MKKSFVLSSILMLLGFFVFSTDAFAQVTTASVSKGFGDFAGLVDDFTGTIVKSIGTLLMAAAVVAFFYGIVEYVWGAREGDSKKIASGNQFMMYALLGLFVMFSVYGIITFFQGVIPGLNNTTIKIPAFSFTRSDGTTNNGGAAGTQTCPTGYANAGKTYTGNIADCGSQTGGAAAQICPQGYANAGKSYRTLADCGTQTNYGGVTTFTCPAGYANAGKPYTGSISNCGAQTGGGTLACPEGTHANPAGTACVDDSATCTAGYACTMPDGTSKGVCSNSGVCELNNTNAQ